MKFEIFKIVKNSLSFIWFEIIFLKTFLKRKNKRRSYDRHVHHCEKYKKNYNRKFMLFFKKRIECRKACSVYLECIVASTDISKIEFRLFKLSGQLLGSAKNII